jgi:hypothetical protein
MHKRSLKIGCSPRTQAGRGGITKINGNGKQGWLEVTGVMKDVIAVARNCQTEISA